MSRLFADAIKAAVPALEGVDPAVMRCATASFGDYQCNAPMGIFKALKAKGDATFASPRAVGEAIASAVPPNVVLASATVSPAGFVNAKVVDKRLGAFCQGVATAGVAKPPPLSAFGGARRVLVDFSSPNIAKEMHVGHLRSTIIGDTICRVLEFCGHDVKRVNHVGDWGTQFGMLISHMAEAYRRPSGGGDADFFGQRAAPFSRRSRREPVISQVPRLSQQSAQHHGFDGVLQKRKEALRRVGRVQDQVARDRRQAPGRRRALSRGLDRTRGRAEISADYPRGSRGTAADSSPRTIHAAAAAPPRTRLHGLSTS